MKVWIPVALALAVSGCAAVRTIAPQTVAGFETGGVLGALDGASGAILARCRTIDGKAIRVTVDSVAIATGTGDLVDRVRDARRDACAKAAEIAAYIDEDGGTALDLPVEETDPAAADPADAAPADAAPADTAPHAATPQP